MSDPFPAKAGCDLVSGLLYSWSLLRNKNTAVKRQIFTSSLRYSRHFAAIAPTEVFFSIHIRFFSRLGCLGLIVKNGVKSVFFKVLN